MDTQDLSMERTVFLKELKDSGKKLSDMVKRTNGHYTVGDAFQCLNVIDDDLVQVIDCKAIDTKRMEKHAHPTSREMLIVVRGSIEIKIEKKTYVLSKGEHILLKCGEQHSTKTLTAGTRMLAILIPPEDAYKR
jgi:quercetin dioxygenase-like cupin family protein